MFKAVVLEQKDGRVSSSIQELEEARLPEGDVTVQVQYSTLNYKDGMMLKGIGGMVRQYPHVPGIDLAGTVAESSNPDFKPGDPVFLTGCRVGESRWGGYAEKARVQGEWLVRPMQGLTLRRAMALGTAGFTAMLAIMALERNGLRPGDGEVLVTGASGGVGSVAVATLANLGYPVVASTGRAESHAYLKSLGATSIIDRQVLAEPSNRPLESERWAGCIETLGGTTLARVLAQTKYDHAVAAVGLVASNKLETTVLPFLLRGVSLIGVESAICPRERRMTAWRRLATDLPMENLDAMTSEATLEELPRLAAEILAGRVRGRLVLKVTA